MLLILLAYEIPSDAFVLFLGVFENRIQSCLDYPRFSRRLTTSVANCTWGPPRKSGHICFVERIVLNEMLDDCIAEEQLKLVLIFSS